MHLLSGLGLGACLADDMGLGKTIQVLSLLLAQRRTGGRCSQACWWGVAARQLGGGNRAVHARPDGEDRAPVGDDAGSGQAGHAGSAQRDRSGDYQLRDAAAHAGACRDALALCHSRRGAGDQEPERQADQGGQGPQSQGTHRADRNAGRKSPGRSVVDLRFHQSRPARNRQAVHQLHQEAGREHAQPLWPAP